MVDLADLSDREWVIPKLVDLRFRWMELFGQMSIASDSRERIMLSYEMSGVAESFSNAAGSFYFDKDFSVYINLPSDKPDWTDRMDSSSIHYSVKSMRQSGRMVAYFIKHPAQFLDTIKTGVSRATVEQQEADYVKLRDQVEDMLDRFKVVLVSDEFL